LWITDGTFDGTYVVADANSSGSDDPYIMSIASGRDLLFAAVDNTGDRELYKISLTSNNTPTSVNDLYSTLEDTPKIVGAPGVLSNDTDAEGNPLTAVLVSGPANGSLTINEDGSLTLPDRTHLATRPMMGLLTVTQRLLA
jgi:hypothetical protein